MIALVTDLNLGIQLDHQSALDGEIREIGE